MKYTTWKIEGIDEYVYLHSLYDDLYGLTLTFNNHGGTRQYKITFDPYFAYRKSEEGYLFEIWASSEYSENPGKTFYKVEDSDYLEWMHNKSCGIYKDQSITHFAIYTDDDCLDILSFTDNPVVEILPAVSKEDVFRRELQAFTRYLVTTTKPESWYLDIFLERNLDEITPQEARKQMDFVIELLRQNLMADTGAELLLILTQLQHHAGTDEIPSLLKKHPELLHQIKTRYPGQEAAKQAETLIRLYHL